MDCAEDRGRSAPVEQESGSIGAISVEACGRSDAVDDGEGGRGAGRTLVRTWRRRWRRSRTLTHITPDSALRRATQSTDSSRAPRSLEQPSHDRHRRHSGHAQHTTPRLTLHSPRQPPTALDPRQPRKMAANFLSDTESGSVVDNGSHRSSDDDSFVLPSFAYEVPDDAYTPAPWERKTKQVPHDDPRADTAQTAIALQKTVRKEDRDHDLAQVALAGASVSAQRTATSSSNMPSSLIDSTNKQVTQPKPPAKPTPQLDLLTQLMVQDLPGTNGLSSSSPPRRAQLQQVTQPPLVVASAPAAPRVDAPSFVSHQHNQSRQQQHPQQQVDMNTPAPWSQLSRALPPHMQDLAQLDMAPSQPKPAAKTTSTHAHGADGPFRDLECLMGASAPAHQTSSSLSLSPFVLPRQSTAPQEVHSSPPSSAATLYEPDPMGGMLQTPSSLELYLPSSSEGRSPSSLDTRLSFPPVPLAPAAVEPRAPSPLHSSDDFDDLIPGLPLSSPSYTPQPQAESSKYPSTFSSYQNSSPGSPLTLPSALYHKAHPPPSYHSNAESTCQPNMLVPDKLDFDYFKSLMRKGVFVRVEGPKNNQLRWTGESATSGYFGRQESFKGLGPEAYEKAARAAGLDRPNWESQEYLWRSMDAHRWPDQGCVPEDSPWISATNNLEWAIWRTANILTSSSTVYMTFIRPTTERHSLPKPPRYISKGARSLKNLNKGNSEVLFYGRIFAESIVARVKWTRTVSFGCSV